MSQIIKIISSKKKISLEVERLSEPKLPSIIGFADLVFLVKNGFNEQKVENFLDNEKKWIGVCPWGEKGAYAQEQGGKCYFSKTNSPKNGVVDSLGAGDTFMGAYLYGYKRKISFRMFEFC